MSTAVVSSFYEFGEYRANVTNSLSNAHKANSCQLLDNQRNCNKQVNESYSFAVSSVDRKHTFHGCGHSAAKLNAVNVNIATRRAVNSTSTTSVPCALLSSAMQQKMTANPVSVVGHQSQQTNNGVVNGGHNGLTYSVSVNHPAITASKEHKKLDRSLSEPADKLVLLSTSRPTSQANSSRYKTELCRPFEENGTCKYGDKCQFAHGFHELRNLQRHPKYKTELCRTFHTSGFCPYGPRCHFIHNSEESKKSVMSTLQAGCPANGKIANRSDTIPIVNGASMKCESAPSTTRMNPIRPKALSIGSYSLGSSGDLSQPSSPSGSPTSLSSFFAEDHLGGNFTPHSTTSNGNVTFSFSPDLTSLVADVSSFASNNANCRNLGILSSSCIKPFAYQKTPDLVKERSASMFSHFPSPTTNGTTAAVIETTQGKTSTSPPLGYPTYPAAPSSPVDSLDSELDLLSLGGGSSPIPTCSSPLELSKSVPRLPIFTRFANITGNSDSE